MSQLIAPADSQTEANVDLVIEEGHGDNSAFSENSKFFGRTIPNAILPSMQFSL